LGGVNQFLPDWVRGELILADAKEGGDLIKEKVAQWKIEKNPAKPICNAEPSRPRSNKPRKPGKRDLRELAKSLGLGDPGRKSHAAPGNGNK
jgi:hypothetical protein